MSINNALLELDINGFTNENGDLGSPVQMEVLRVPKKIEIYKGGLAWKHSDFEFFNNHISPGGKWDGKLPDPCYLPRDPHALRGPDSELWPIHLTNFLRIFGYVDYYEEKKSGTKILTEFLKLDLPQSIFSFAQKYGVFGFAERSGETQDCPPIGKPSLWSRNYIYSKPLEVKTECSNEIWYWESFDEWRTVVDRAKATLKMACAQAGGWLVPADTAKLALNRGFEKKQDNSDSWYSSADCLKECLNRWLLEGEITLQIPKKFDNLKPHFVGNGLFSVIAMQILTTIAKTSGVGFCSSCGDLFTPSNNKKKYCGRCGIKASWRKAAKKQYDKKRKLKNEVKTRTE